MPQTRAWASAISRGGRSTSRDMNNTILDVHRIVMHVSGMHRIAGIKALRQRIGLTQKQLADAVGVKPNTVARWERGELAISAPMKDRIERVADSHRSGSAVTRSSAVTLDPHHQAILQALNRRLDPDVFEACAAALLRPEWPTLVPVRGGADDGFDGAVADPTGEPFRWLPPPAQSWSTTCRAISSRYVAGDGSPRACCSPPQDESRPLLGASSLMRLVRKT